MISERIETKDSTNNAAVRSAAVVAPIVLSAISPIRSAVEVGCASGGVWGSAFERSGVDQVVAYVDGVSLTHCALADAQMIDLLSARMPQDRFDLCIYVDASPDTDRLELIAHRLAGLADHILVGACHPGGRPAWPSAWRSVFIGLGYEATDLIRPQVWDDVRVDTRYRESLIVFSKTPIAKAEPAWPLGLDVVHPERFENLRTVAAASENLLGGFLQRLCDVLEARDIKRVRTLNAPPGLEGIREAVETAIFQAKKAKKARVALEEALTKARSDNAAALQAQAAELEEARRLAAKLKKQVARLTAAEEAPASAVAKPASALPAAARSGLRNIVARALRGG